MFLGTISRQGFRNIRLETLKAPNTIAVAFNNDSNKPNHC